MDKEKVCRKIFEIWNLDVGDLEILRVAYSDYLQHGSALGEFYLGDDSGVHSHIFIDAYNGRDRQEQTLVHEVGHFLSRMLWPEDRDRYLKRIHKARRFVSRYASRNQEEDFADTFLYLTYGDRVQSTKRLLFERAMSKIRSRKRLFHPMMPSPWNIQKSLAALVSESARFVTCQEIARPDATVNPSVIAAARNCLGRHGQSLVVRVDLVNQPIQWRNGSLCGLNGEMIECDTRYASYPSPFG